ncbi:MAG: addiction module protein [Verrucomicrobiia bacterium]
MTTNIEKVAVEVLTLPTEDRAYLAHRLIRSLDEAADENAEAEWEATLNRRWREIEEDRVECADALAVIEEIKAQLRARPSHPS